MEEWLLYIKMKEIILSTGEKAIVDDFSYGYLSKFKWYRIVGGSSTYAIRSYRRFGRTFSVRMHQDLINTEKFIDHIDGNGLNNSHENLRECTHSENMMNRRKSATASSKYKGVQWWKAQGKWAVEIAKNKKRIFIGYFNDEIEAALAYNKAAMKHFGEFAKLNQI